MKTKLFSILIGVFLFTSGSVASQSLMGAWKGHFITTGIYGNDTIRFSIYIKQDSAGTLIAETYSILPGFYGEANAEVIFDAKTKRVLINENRMVRWKSEGWGISPCLMKMDLNFKELKHSEELTGTFISSSPENYDCGKGKIYLARSKPE